MIRGSFEIQDSEWEGQETIKEGQIKFGTVDLGNKLESVRLEDGTGKEEKS